MFQILKGVENPTVALSLFYLEAFFSTNPRQAPVSLEASVTLDYFL